MNKPWDSDKSDIAHKIECIRSATEILKTFGSDQQFAKQGAPDYHKDLLAEAAKLLILAYGSALR